MQDWLHRSVQPGVEVPWRADFDTSGEIKIGRWWRYEACQAVAPPTDRVWSATAHFGLISVEACDRFTRGTGDMSWTASGRIPVLRARGGGIDRSVAGLLAAETLLVPTFAMYPWVRWEQVAPHRAVAEITIGTTMHAVEVAFDDGRLASCALPRWSQTGRHGRTRVFGIQCCGEATHEGITTPARWTAGWDWDGDDWRHGPHLRAQLDSVRWTTGGRPTTPASA